MAYCGDNFASCVEGFNGALQGRAINEIGAGSMSSTAEDGVDARSEVDRFQFDGVAELANRCSVVLREWYIGFVSGKTTVHREYYNPCAERISWV